VSQYVTEFGKGNSSVKDVLPLGVLDEVKGTVCYVAQLMKAGSTNTGDVTLVDLSAMTSVDNQPIMMVQWTKFVDATPIANALGSLKRSIRISRGPTARPIEPILRSIELRESPNGSISDKSALPTAA
jgi:hypothetical protein